MERWLETAQNSWVHRAERVKDRNHAAANSVATQKLLDAAPATASLALRAASEPDYSYPHSVATCSICRHRHGGEIEGSNARGR